MDTAKYDSKTCLLAPEYRPVHDMDILLASKTCNIHIG